MLLNELPKLKNKGRKRLGRGLSSGKGAKSGRGTTRHQKARQDIALSFEGGQNKLTKKFPLLRGKGRNKSVHTKPLLITLSTLESISTDKEITLDLLIEKGILGKENKVYGAKVVANGTISHPITINIPLSQSAREKIEKAGGKVTI